MDRLGPCSIQQETHVCVAIEPKKIVAGKNGETLVAVKDL
jgi:hypothetical protein